MPLLLACLDNVGRIAQKYPNSATNAIACLRDFLVDPAPVLAKLHAHAAAQHRMHAQLTTVTIKPEPRADNDDQEYQDEAAAAAAAASSAIDWVALAAHQSRGHSARAQTTFERLRDRATANLCAALRAAHAVDPYCVPALVANVSNRLFAAETSHKSKERVTLQPATVLANRRGGDSPLAAMNIIVMLGHVAVALQDTPKTAHNILQFFIQRFDKVPAEQNVLIVDQLGGMVVAQCEPLVLDEIMRMFAREAVKSAATAYKTDPGCR